MEFKYLFFGLLFLSSFASLVSANEPGWESLIGNSTINLAGAPSQNNSCSFIGNDPNCGKYVIGLMVLIIFLTMCVVSNVPSEASMPLGLILILLISSWGWLPAMFMWIGGALAGIVIFMILYRFIGG